MQRRLQLWWEKLSQSGIVGQSRGAGGVGGAGGYHHRQAKTEPHVLQFASGLPPARMPPAHSGAEVFGNIKRENQFPQTDGADVGDTSGAGAAASRRDRRPRRGDYVELEVSMGGGGPSEAKFLNLDQLDGAGAGPRKRGRDEGETLRKNAKSLLHPRPYTVLPSCRGCLPDACVV